MLGLEKEPMAMRVQARVYEHYMRVGNSAHEQARCSPSMYECVGGKDERARVHASGGSMLHGMCPAESGGCNFL